jgi:hypothetical protein
MTCSDVRGLMSAALDERVSAEQRAAIDQHLARCEPCRAELGELEALDAALAAMPSPEPPAGYQETLWSRLKMALSDDPKERREDSGLLDIRKMAFRDIKANEEARKRTTQELELVVTSEIPPSISQPMVVSRPAARRRHPSWLVPVASLGGLVIVAGVVLGLLVTSRKPLVKLAEEPTAAPSPVRAAFSPVGAEPEAVSASAPTGLGPRVALPGPAEGVGEPPGAGAIPALDQAGEAKMRSRAGGPDDGTARRAAKLAANHGRAKEPSPAAALSPVGRVAAKPAAPALGGAAVAKVPTPAAGPAELKLPEGKAPSPLAKTDDVDELLRSGAAAKKDEKKDEKKVDAEESLPESLKPDQIKSGMNGVRAKVQECFDQHQVAGLAKLAVTISRAGTVTGAAITGDFAGSPTGACVVAAVKTATFPRFKGKPLAINYTFLLR